MLSSLMAIASGYAQAQTAHDLFVNHQAGMVDYFASDASGSQVSGPAGAEFIYQARVGINGTASQIVRDVTLTQQLPTGAVFQSINAPQGTTCTNPPAMGVVLDENNARIDCLITSVAGGGEDGGYVDVDFRVILPSVDSNWQAFASAVSASNSDPQPSNNTDLERRITTYAAADLQLQFTGPAADATLIDGASFNYQLQVTNKQGAYGKDVLAGEQVVVRFEQPNGAQFTGTPSGTNWQCKSSANPNPVWECTFTASNTIAKGMALPALSVPATAKNLGTILATASVSSLDDKGQEVRDVVPNDNIDTISVTVASDNVINVNVTKTANPPVLDQLGGEQTVTYTITPRWASGTGKPGWVRVTDTLPKGVTIDRDAVLEANGSSAWNCEASTSTQLSCIFASNGSSYPSKGTNFPGVIVPATVSGETVEAGQALHNTATVAAELEDQSQLDDNTATATVNISNVANLALAKSPVAEGGGQVGVIKNGTTYAYQIRITNNGPLAIRKGQTLTVSDQLHHNLVFIAATDSNAGTSPASTQWSCSDATAVEPATASIAPRATGNAGALVNCSYTADADIPANKSIDLFLWVQVLGLGTNETAILTNTASVTGVSGRDPLKPGTGIGNSANVNVSDKPADLAITKTAVPGAIVDASNPTKSGDLVTYTLTVTNNGNGQNQPAKTVVVKDQISNLITDTYAAEPFNILPIDNNPNGSGFYWHSNYLTVRIANTNNGQDSCSLGGYDSSKTVADLVCTFHEMPVNASYTITVQAKQFADPYTGNAAHVPTGILANGTDGVLKNTASVSSPDTNDSDLSNNSATAYVVMQALTDLELKRQASPLNGDKQAQAAAGGAITYLLTVENKGPSAAAEVYVEDVLPLGAYWIGLPPAASNNGQCGYRLAGAGELLPFKDGDLISKNNQTLVCEWAGNFAKGQQTIEYKLRSEQLGPTALDSAAEVFTTTPEIREDNNTAIQTVLLTEPQVDVEIEMRHTADGIALGNGTTYTITVTNIAGSDSYARNVVMTNEFHSPLYDKAGNAIADSNAFFAFGTITGLKSTGRDAGAEPFSAENCESETTNTRGGGLTCTFPWMAPGESVDISFTMTAKSLLDNNAVGTIFHKATVVADFENYDYGTPASGREAIPKVLQNNSTQDRTSTYDPAQIDPTNPDSPLWADLELNKSVLSISHEDPEAAEDDPVTAGSTVQYQLVVRNLEKDAALIATNVVVTDALPPGVTPVGSSMPGICSYAADSHTVSCAIGSLAAEQQQSISFSVTLDTPYNQTGTSLRNCAAVSSYIDPVEGNNNSCAEIPAKRTVPPTPVAVPSLNTGAVLMLALFMMAMTWRTRRRGQ